LAGNAVLGVPQSSIHADAVARRKLRDGIFLRDPARTDDRLVRFS
jgi:hypothetical protein